MELLERGSQLQVLDQLLHDAVAGSGRLVLLAGEAGSGKSALVNAFIARQAGTCRVLVGACDALSSPRPLGPLFDVAALLDVSIRRLLRDHERRSELFSGVLASLSDSLPTLYVIEDAHWADEATLDLLRYLGRRITRTRALLVVTYRDDEVSTAHPLKVALGDLATASGVCRLAVPSLSVAAVKHLCGAASIDPVDLHRRTGGNAFHVAEVIAAGGETIPATVRDAVLARVARLSPAAHRVLETAAVIGERIDPALLIGGGDETDDAIEECLVTGLLRGNGGNFQFRHQLAQQAVLDTISPLKVRQIHAAVLANLRASPGFGQDLAILAHHAEAAGDTGAVLEFAPAAAARAVQLGAHRQALDQYARALRFCRPGECAQRSWLLEKVFLESYDVGQFATALDASAELREAAQAVSDVPTEARWLAAKAKCHIVLGENSQGEREIAAALNLIEGLPVSPCHADVYRQAAAVRMLNRDCEEAIALGERAIALCRQFGNTESLITTIGVVGSARIVSGEVEAGSLQMEESLQLAQAHGLDFAAAVAYTNLGSGLGEMVQFAPAERYLTEGIAFSAERDIDGHRLYMTSWLALVRLGQGRWSEAADFANAVCQNPATTSIARIMALIALGRVRTRRGDPDAASVLDEALALAEPTGTLQRIAPVRAARAERAWLVGDPDRCAAEARAAFDLAIAHRHPWHIGELSYWRWLAGDLDSPDPAMAAPYRAQFAGEHRAAAESWRALGCPYESARALSGSEDETDLREAFTLFDALGAGPAAGLLLQRMRALGLHSIPRGAQPTTRGNPARLTRREREVLKLVSAGHSNSEIATQLYLSPKTIEHHITSILTKLDVTSRRAAVEAMCALDPSFQTQG